MILRTGLEPCTTELPDPILAAICLGDAATATFVGKCAGPVGTEKANHCTLSRIFAHVLHCGVVGIGTVIGRCDTPTTQTAPTVGTVPIVDATGLALDAHPPFAHLTVVTIAIIPTGLTIGLALAIDANGATVDGRERTIVVDLALTALFAGPILKPIDAGTFCLTGIGIGLPIGAADGLVDGLASAQSLGDTSALDTHRTTVTVPWPSALGLGSLADDAPAAARALKVFGSIATHKVDELALSRTIAHISDGAIIGVRTLGRIDASIIDASLSAGTFTVAFAGPSGSAAGPHFATGHSAAGSHLSTGRGPTGLGTTNGHFAARSFTARCFTARRHCAPGRGAPCAHFSTAGRAAGRHLAAARCAPGRHLTAGGRAASLTATCAAGFTAIAIIVVIVTAAGGLAPERKSRAKRERVGHPVSSHRNVPRVE